MNKMHDNYRPDTEVLNAIDAVFAPKSIVVIGASENESKFGGRVMRNLTRYGYDGTIYPVNRRGDAILGIPGYASLDDVPGPVDLAIIVVPKSSALEALEGCGRLGVKAAIVITSGYAEQGGEGVGEQEDLVASARRLGIRILGPNSLGAYHAGNKLAATGNQAFDRQFEPGNVALISQSGALGGSFLDAGMNQGLRFSSFLSIGNSADLEIPDVLLHQIHDPSTRVVLLYIEGLRDLDKLDHALSEARRLGKTVIVLRAGWSEQGASAIQSHTGSLAGSSAAYKAIFRRHGVIEVDDVQDALEAALAASAYDIDGRRVGFISVSGGMGSLAADRSEAVGLEMGAFSEETRRKLRDVLPDFAPENNPLDVTGAVTSSPGMMQMALEIVAADEGIDVIVMLITVVYGSERIADEVVAASATIGKPIMAVVCGGECVAESATRFRAGNIPVFEQLHGALQAISRVGSARASASGETGQAPELDAETREAIDSAVRTGSASLLTEHQSKAILRLAGVPVCDEAIVQTAEEAGANARAFGFPVVLKGVTTQIAHKMKAGLVKLNVCDEAGAARAFDEIHAAAKKAGGELEGVSVQPMVAPGVELLIGGMRDPQAGPLIAFGLGGVYTEALRQVTFRPAPVGRAEAMDMIGEIPSARGLLGEDNERLAPLADAIVGASLLMAGADNVAELDINPFIYYPGEGRGIAVDGLIRRDDE